MTTNESEPTVDDSTRGAILEALVMRTQKNEAPKKGFDSSKEVDEKTTFSELLERSLEKREEIDEEQAVESDEIRQRAIKESKVDMIGDIMKRLL